MIKLVYLASPYSHPSEDIKHERFESAVYAAGYLMNQGYHVFGAIAHSHPIAMACNLPGGWEYWSQYDRRMIESCDELIILQIEGCRESIGVKAEFEIARELNKPVYRMIPVDGDHYEITLVEGDLW